MGSIINVSTAGALRPGLGELPYAVAKAGLNALTLGLAGAFGPRVRCNVLIPGAFDTDITLAWTPEMKELAGTTNPLARIGDPDDMVGPCLFLASDASSYVNGAQILVDGGRCSSACFGGVWQAAEKPNEISGERPRREAQRTGANFLGSLRPKRLAGC